MGVKSGGDGRLKGRHLIDSIITLAPRLIVSTVCYLLLILGFNLYINFNYKRKMYLRIHEYFISSSYLEYTRFRFIQILYYKCRKRFTSFSIFLFHYCGYGVRDSQRRPRIHPLTQCLTQVCCVISLKGISASHIPIFLPITFPYFFSDLWSKK